MLSQQLGYGHVFLYGEKQLLPEHHVFRLKTNKKKNKTLQCAVINTPLNILSPFVVKTLAQYVVVCLQPQRDRD